ncbi:serine hydrolase domain-containing protein [Steroidobacter agaridevorans]|uniref:serine hydrolase domain-containing protein n=1 Tax=Steroidobacter agaridevorans TaxID=2695856 RepID=UPI001379411C|nr:serine hydrolase [Steroidobacter agaridevorans]
MRVMPREPQISRSEMIRRCRQAAISISLALTIAACGGGGGGGGQPTAPVQQNPPPPTTPANTAPTVEAGDPQTIEWPTATAQLNGSATDDASQTLTYAWTATSGPSGVTFGTANAAATSVTFPSEGTYVLTLSVNDGSATGTDTVTITVNPAPAQAAVYPASDAANDDPVNHGWATVAAADVGMDQSVLDQAVNYARTSGTVNQADNAGMIVRGGRVVASWGVIDQRYDMKSTTKSIGGMALGLAMKNGLRPSDTAASKLPTIGNKPLANGSTGWLGEITIEQLATHTAGFLKDDDLTGAAEPAAATLVDRPGTIWRYSDIGLNWLAEVLTAVLAEDLSTALQANVWTTLGLNSSSGPTGGGSLSDVHWRDNQYRDQDGGPYKRELASGMFVNVNAMARVGLLFLRKGMWANDQRVLEETFVSTVSTPVATNANLPNPLAAEYPGATTNYGVLWWTNANGQLPNVPRDAYWAWGLGDSLIVVIPSLDIVAVRAGAQAAADSSVGSRVWNDDDWNGDYAVLAPFLDPIVQSVSR